MRRSRRINQTLRLKPCDKSQHIEVQAIYHDTCLLTWFLPIQSLDVHTFILLRKVPWRCKQTQAYSLPLTLPWEWKGHLFSNSVENHISLPPLFFFFGGGETLVSFCSGPRNAMDNHCLFQLVFLTQAARSRRTTEKGKIPMGAAFYFQFVFICPPAPLGCLWERVSTCFIGRYCVSGSKSVFTHRCEWRTSVSVPLLFLYQIGIIWVRMALAVSPRVNAGRCASGTCTCAYVLLLFFFEAITCFS